MSLDTEIEIAAAATAILTWVVDRLGIKVPRVAYWTLLILSALAFLVAVGAAVFATPEVKPELQSPQVSVRHDFNGQICTNGANCNFQATPKAKPLPQSTPIHRHNPTVKPPTGNCVISGGTNYGTQNQTCVN